MEAALESALETELPSVSILRVQPGDHLIVSFQEPLSEHAVEQIKAKWDELVEGTNLEFVKIFLLDCGAKMEVLRAQVDKS